MKKFCVYAAMLLATAMTWSCANVDNIDEIVNQEKPVQIEHEGLIYNMYTIGTFTAEPGSDVSLTLGVYDPYDIYGVDFGDGLILVDTVSYQNGGLKDEQGYTKEGTSHKSATQFAGKVGGDGLIKVMGNSPLWYLYLTGGVMPTSFTQPRMKNVQSISISGAVADAIDLTGLDSLTSFSFSQGSLANINVTALPQLKKLTINNNTVSNFESTLQSIDLSGNPALEELNLMAASTEKPGLLKSLDLSNNTKLTNIYAQNNQISSIQLPAGAALKFLNLENNKLTQIDLSMLKSLKDTYLDSNQLTTIDLSMLVEGANLYLNDNQLTELVIPVSVKNMYAQNNQLTKFSVVNTTTSCKIENNRLTLATLPVRPAGLNTIAKKLRFTYAPQAPVEVPANVQELDLTSQLTAQGVQEEPVETTFSFATESGKALVENVDYQQTEPGKFIFIKEQNEKIHAILASMAFPNLIKDEYNDIELVTTDFTVTVSTPIVKAQVWDFTTWSAETIANLKADAATSKTTGWSDVEKAADAEANADPTELSKENCFWYQAETNADGTLSANGVVIKELVGLKFDNEYAKKRSLAIAVNYPHAINDYAGPSYLWLGGGTSKQKFPCFTIPGVKAGQKLTVELESHKGTDARGIQIYANSYEEANQIGEAFKPTTKDSHTWTIESDCDVVVWNTSGCHIYKMTLE